MATKTWVGQQGFLTSSAISDMATKTWVGQQGYLTSSAISDMATKTWVGQQGFLTSVSGAFWGQSWSNGATISGSLTGVGSITSNTNGIVDGFSSIELKTGVNAGHGGYIDFHFNGSSADYTSRIAEFSSGVLTAVANGLVVGSANGDYVQIGPIRIIYDSTNNALKIQKADGTAAGILATGGVSALNQ
jgi:hypothetical protein